MLNIVAKLDESTGTDLTVSDEIKVAASIRDAVARIDAWPGELFGVWHTEHRPNPIQAEEAAHMRKPDKVYVLSRDGHLMPLHPDVCGIVR